MSPQRRPEIAKRFLDLAERFLAEHRPALAFQALFGIDDLDTSATARHAAIDRYWQLARAEPPEREAYDRIGRLAAIAGIRLEDGEAALKAFLAEPAPRRDPSHAAAHWRLGMIYEKRAQSDLARQHYEAALKLEPNHAQATRALEAMGRARH